MLIGNCKDGVCLHLYGQNSSSHCVAVSALLDLKGLAFVLIQIPYWCSSIFFFAVWSVPQNGMVYTLHRLRTRPIENTIQIRIRKASKSQKMQSICSSILPCFVEKKSQIVKKVFISMKLHIFRIFFSFLSFMYCLVDF